MIINICLFLARFLGLIQRALGRGQTHLLTIAQNHGWKPDSRHLALLLQKRQVGLAIRAGMQRLDREERKLERQKKRRFHKTYPSE